MHQIKKYANGRLYDTTAKKYITMEEMEQFLRAKTPFRVVVSKTDEDITDSIIAKIKKEERPKKGKTIERPSGKKPRVVPRMEKKKEGLSKSQKEAEEGEKRPESILGKMFRMGEETLAGYNQKYAELFHSAMTMAEEEFDKRIKQLIKAKELSESEAGRMKHDVKSMTANIKNWLGGNVEERIHGILSEMNLATRDQVERLSEKINELNKKLEGLEKGGK